MPTMGLASTILDCAGEPSVGAPPWEASYVAGMAKCRQFLIERRRPRNYTKRGLRKET